MNAKQPTEHISLKEKKIFLQDEINDLLRLEIQILYMNKASMLRNVKNVKNLCVLKYFKKKKFYSQCLSLKSLKWTQAFNA